MSSPEIMRRIVEAEKESRRILEETNREIAEMRKRSPNEIDSIRQQILREATERKKKVIVEAEKSGAEEAERIASDARRQVEALFRISEARRKQAAEKAMALLLS